MMRRVVSGTLLAVWRPRSRNHHNNSYSNLQNISNLRESAGGRCRRRWEKTGISGKRSFAFLLKVRQISGNQFFFPWEKIKTKKPWKGRRGCAQAAWALPGSFFFFKPPACSISAWHFPQTSSSWKCSAIMHQKSLQTACVHSLCCQGANYQNHFYPSWSSKKTKKPIWLFFNGFLRRREIGTWRDTHISCVTDPQTFTPFPHRRKKILVCLPPAWNDLVVTSRSAKLLPQLHYRCFCAFKKIAAC